jgi:hypothetical protein
MFFNVIQTLICFCAIFNFYLLRSTGITRTDKQAQYPYSTKSPHSVKKYCNEMIINAVWNSNAVGSLIVTIKSLRSIS